MPKKILRPWTDPVISPKSTNAQNVGHHCYVWFRYLDQEKGEWTHPIKRKPALFQPYSKKEHYLELKALAKAIHYKLSVEGWNPVNNTFAPVEFDLLPVDDQISRARYFTFTEAIQFALEKKKSDWSPRSYKAYEGVVRFLITAARSLKIDDKIMGEFELPHFKALLEEARRTRKLSAKGFNKYREYLSGLVTEMIQWQIVKLNLVYHVNVKKTEKNQANRPPTRDEQTIIINRIKNVNPAYYRFLAVLYGCVIRPEEITRLQIKHLHKKEGVFRIPAAGTKTKEFREVVIPDWVMGVLSELNLHNYDPNFYIFSTFNKYKTFKPGPQQMHVHSTQRIWNKIVKDPKTGLGIDVNQYGLKKLAGDDMVRMQVQNNTSNLLELPRQQMGHGSTDMTGVYVQEHNEVNKQLIRKSMPEL